MRPKLAGNKNWGRNTGARPTWYLSSPDLPRFGEQEGLAPVSVHRSPMAPHREAGCSAIKSPVLDYFRVSAESTGIQAHGPRGQDHLSTLPN